MRVAIMSDIHGFSLALDRVLADIEGQGRFDHIVVAGDLCEGGPAPDDVLHRLEELSIPCVQGNTDADIADGSRRSRAAVWTRNQIGPSGIDFLRHIPFELRIKPAPDAPDAHDLLIVHANPFDLHRHMRPDASDRELEELLGDTRAAAIAFGHLHIPYVRRVGDYLLVDVSSVGNPRDGDLRCAWGEIEWDEAKGSWQAEIRRLPYPTADTIAQIHDSGIPKGDRLIESLLRAAY